MRALPRLPWRARDIAAYLFIVTVAAPQVLAFVWMARHVLAIRRLTRGVGDTVFYARDGRPWFRLDESRRDAPLARIAPHLRDAVIAIEDHSFRRHVGIDPIALVRAVVRNVQAGAWVEGGSTITQQLARTLFLSTNRTYARKLKEGLLALLLEMQLSKDQILELYLNRVYLGARVYGVHTMASRCFGKSAANVSLAEAALIAGVIQSPGRLSPWKHLEAARRRSHLVLARMRDEGYIDAGREREARSARLRIGPPPVMQQARWGYAKEYLREAFAEEIGGDHPPDWRVETTFVPELQDAAESAVTGGLRRLRIPNLQAALVALEPKTGDVLAIVGGHDPTRSPFNRAARSRRQPGSAFKPFVYAAALQRGYSPVSVLEGLHSVTVRGREEWSPRNTHDSPDVQSLREALLQSNNQAAVLLQQRIGTGAVLKLAEAAGLRDLPDVPSLALGSGLVTPLDLTAAFAVFPNGGYAVKPRGIRRVIDEDGDLVFENDDEPRRILPEPVAFQTLTMLQDVLDYGTGTAARDMGLRGPAGGKTGTTNEFVDAWFVGFTSSVVVGVWVGFDAPAPIGREAYGGRIALPIWTEFVRRTQGRLPMRAPEVPPGMREVEFCRVSYQRAVRDCPSYVEFLKADDDVPSTRCAVHRGTLKEKIDRALDRILSDLGKRLRRIFD